MKKYKVGDNVIFHKKYEDLNSHNLDFDKIKFGTITAIREGNEDLSYHGSAHYATVTTISTKDEMVFENTDYNDNSWYMTEDEFYEYMERCIAWEKREALKDEEKHKKQIEHYYAAIEFVKNKKVSSEKEKLLEYMKEHTVASASDSLRDPYFAMSSFFSLEDVAKMSNETVKNCLRVARTMGMALDDSKIGSSIFN